jgi:FtsZ-binding cell division protein ZapB
MRNALPVLFIFTLFVKSTLVHSTNIPINESEISLESKISQVTILKEVGPKNLKFLTSLLNQKELSEHLKNKVVNATIASLQNEIDFIKENTSKEGDRVNQVTLDYRSDVQAIIEALNQHLNENHTTYNLGQDYFQTLLVEVNRYLKPVRIDLNLELLNDLKSKDPNIVIDTLSKIEEVRMIGAKTLNAISEILSNSNLDSSYKVYPFRTAMKLVLTLENFSKVDSKTLPLKVDYMSEVITFLSATANAAKENKTPHRFENKEYRYLTLGGNSLELVLSQISNILSQILFQTSKTQNDNCEGWVRSLI